MRRRDIQRYIDSVTDPTQPHQEATVTDGIVCDICGQGFFAPVHQEWLRQVQAGERKP